IQQYKRQRQALGRYIGYHMTYDDETVVLLDGDDQLYNDTVLNTIDNVYKNRIIACTYGSYVDKVFDHISNLKKGCEIFPASVIESRSYRYHKYLTGHLRTCKSKLLKQIDLYDLLDNNNRPLKLMTDF